MSYTPSEPKFETDSLIVRLPMPEPKKPLVIVAEWAFLIVAALVGLACMWAVFLGLE